MMWINIAVSKQMLKYNLNFVSNWELINILMASHKAVMSKSLVLNFIHPF
jgi:hypothetical protein